MYLVTSMVGGKDDEEYIDGSAWEQLLSVS